MEKPHKLADYDGKEEFDEHVQLVDESLSYFTCDEASKWNFFALTLVGLPQLWFNGLHDGCINLTAQFYKRFSVLLKYCTYNIVVDEIFIWDWSNSINKTLMRSDFEEATTEVEVDAIVETRVKVEAVTNIPDTVEVEDGVIDISQRPQRTQTLPVRLQDYDVAGDGEVTPDGQLIHFALLGGGSKVKRKRIGFMNRTGEADVCFIQETKLSGINEGMVKEMWGEDRFEFSYLDAIGASGGIIRMWRKDFFKVLFSFRGEGFLGKCMEKEGKLIYLVNVYASCVNSNRRITWKKLVEYSRKFQLGYWCVGGDFNVVSAQEERVGFAGSRHRKEISQFQDFIAEMKLVDIPTIGGKFTWFNSNGKSMSRIDRFLLSESFIEDWNIEGQYIGARDISDHAPIWIKNNRKDWGPKPFKFNNGTVHEEEVRRRAKVVEVFWENLYKKESYLRLKSRQSWLAEGDNNTGFFHCSLRGRRSKNKLCSLQYNGRRLEEVSEIKEAVFNHFNGFFMEPELNRPRQAGQVHLFGFHCPHSQKSKPPRFNGVQADLLGWKSLQNLIENAGSKDQKSAGRLISCNQSAFVPGRNMLDGVLLVNEVIDWAKRNKSSCLLLKVDFEKAYDSLSWNFLRDMLVRMGFGKRWLMWMDACIFSSHLSVLVNGSATHDFMVHRGLRQGDPLSPFLFVLAMEALTALVRNSVVVGGFKPFQFRIDEGVDILQFADNTIIFGEASTANLWNLKVILRGFELISGLKINFSKSSVMGVNVGDWILDAATNFLACKRGNSSFLFLGIMVGVNPRNKKVWSKVLYNFKKRLDTWKGRNISIGGRVTLINAVLNAIPSFTFSFYKSPLKVLNKIRGIQRNFLWSGNANKRSINWVKWDTICKPKDKGGLGVRDVGEFNRALLLKWKWRLLKDDGAVWKSFVQWRYKNIRLKVFLPAGEGFNAKDSKWWRDVLSIDILRDNSEEGFSSCVQCIANNGSSISFWYSIWLENQSLRISFPNFFDLSTNKYASVGDIVEWDNGTQRWKFENLFESVSYFQVLNTIGGLQSANWQQFLDIVNSYSLDSSAEDGFVWIPRQDGVFTVASVAVLLEEHKESAWGPDINRRLSIMWKSSVPLKIKIFAWRLLISRLPLKDMLVLRGMVANIIDPKCPFCDIHEESLDHLFFLCQASKNIWEKVLAWIGFSSGSFWEAFLGLDDIQLKVTNSHIRNKVNVIWLANTWSLWLMRNDNVFNNVPFSFETVFNRIVFLSWRWSECSFLLPRSSFYDWYKLPL
ncbi:uncharacterized protein LOC131630662 [Vicia villosa]|uniref:uncharacterized protein LOC131630662 n=1 Tax=Vicia villosa TaxID=3911 RepID=UPI00273CB28A|nr:uncharacterized protein LOC131630662 [Vicia villosa]